MNFFAGEIALGTLSDLWNSLDFSAMLSALMRLIAVFLCLTVHETCHGLAAYALGDPTAKREHRLSLNPLHHIDWVGLACMLVLGFGWAKPVPVDMRYFKKPKQGMALTALAGPVSNLLLAIMLLFLAAFIKGVDEYQDILRCCVSYPGNDLRLGGKEDALFPQRVVNAGKDNFRRLR